MAIFFDAPVSPDALTAYVNEVPIPSDLRLLADFGSERVNDNTVDFAEIVRTNRTARFRTFDGRIHVSERDVGSERRVSLLPLSSSLNMGEYERLQLQFAMTGGTRTAALANAIYNDATNLTREIQNRLELAWGDVLSDGKLTINEGGYQGEADFGVPANQIVSAGTVWTSVSTATPLTNLTTWMDVLVDAGKGGDYVIRTSNRILRVMLRNKEIIDAVYGATAGRTRVTLAELNDLLGSEGLPTLVPTYDSRFDVDGVSTRAIADDKVILTPRNLGELGYTAWGVSATALELVNSNVSDMSFEEVPGIVGVVEKVGPPYRQFTFVDAVAMPILADAGKLFIADVA